MTVYLLMGLFTVAGVSGSGVNLSQCKVVKLFFNKMCYPVQISEQLKQPFKCYCRWRFAKVVSDRCQFKLEPKTPDGSMC